MKNKILLKSFLTLALVLTLGTQVSASEVVGNISSSMTQSGGSEVSGTLDNGIIAGNVEGSSTSSGSRRSGNSSGNNAGTVLGASTVRDISLLDNLSTDGTSLQPSSRSLALGTTSTSDTSGSVLGVETAEAAPGTQTTDGSYGIGNWFWIILLLLLLIAIITYIYNRRDNKSRV